MKQTLSILSILSILVILMIILSACATTPSNNQGDAQTMPQATAVSKSGRSCT